MAQSDYCYHPSLIQGGLNKLCPSIRDQTSAFWSETLFGSTHWIVSATLSPPGGRASSCQPPWLFQAGHFQWTRKLGLATLSSSSETPSINAPTRVGHHQFFERDAYNERADLVSDVFTSAQNCACVAREQCRTEWWQSVPTAPPQLDNRVEPAWYNSPFAGQKYAFKRGIRVSRDLSKICIQTGYSYKRGLITEYMSGFILNWAN